jgi:hypothetical protein
MKRFNKHTFRLSVLCKAIALAGAATFSSAGGAAEITTDPGDYAPLPPGTKIGLLYYQHAERNSYYVNGDKMPVPFELVTDIGLARYVNYTKLGDMTANWQFVIPFGKVDLRTPFGPLAEQSASGVGDPLVGVVLWPMNNPEQQRSLAVSAFASVPVGKYDSAKGPVNLGENRWKGIFQTGYNMALTKSVWFDVVAEYAVYGENDDFLGLTRKQDASYGFQTHLRYVVSPGTHLGLSYYRDFGGESELNGVAQHDRMNNSRWQATVASFVTPTVQLQLQAGKSLETHNGARESDRINVRVVKVF